MIEGWVLWLVLVGLAIGVVVAVVALVRLPREEDDVSSHERRAEAAWIAGTIERHGGIAPVSLVEEVLDLHQAYLRAPRASSTGVVPPQALPAAPPPPAAPTQSPPPPRGVQPPSDAAAPPRPPVPPPLLPPGSRPPQAR